MAENAGPGRLMRLGIGTSALALIAGGLSFAQTVAMLQDGAMLLAEQGENRILRLRRAQ